MSKGNKIVATIGVLLIAVLIIGIVFFLKERKHQNDPQIQQQKQDYQQYQTFQSNSDYYVKSIEQNNLTGCNSISDENTQNECKLSYLVNNPYMLTFDNCKSYLTGSQFGRCEEWVYYRAGDCEKIKINLTMQTSCLDLKYLKIAQSNKEITFCDKIKSDTTKKDCINFFLKK